MRKVLGATVVISLIFFAMLNKASAQESFYPKDPYRQIGTNIYSAASMSKFYGLVLEVQPNGIRLRGFCGKPGGMGWEYGPNKFLKGDGEEFFVEGFPYEIAEGDFLAGDSNYAGWNHGVYTYKTVMGSTRTIHKIIYGKVYHIPPRQNQSLHP